MQQPKVSKLTNCYNREKYIAACIESVLSSSYQDWEMISVDDQFRNGYVINNNY